MKTFKFSLVLRTRENTDVFIAFKRVNILCMYEIHVPAGKFATGLVNKWPV